MSRLMSFSTHRYWRRFPSDRELRRRSKWDRSSGVVLSARNFFQTCSALMLPSGNVGKFHPETLEELVAEDEIKDRPHCGGNQRRPTRSVAQEHGLPNARDHRSDGIDEAVDDLQVHVDTTDPVVTLGHSSHKMPPGHKMPSGNVEVRRDQREWPDHRGEKDPQRNHKGQHLS